MASQEELRSVRLGKLEALKAAGINPYPAETEKTHTCSKIQKDFKVLEKKGETLVLAGRIMALRGQGAISFVEIFDGTGRFQVVLKKDSPLEYSQEGIDLEDAFSFFKDTVDVGDFVEFSGTPFVTQRGAESLEGSSWKMLTKALLPIPTEHFGLKDEEERFRNRHLDILINPETRELLEQRSHFWRVTRRFFEDEGFLEVETPTLEVTTGGAEATPFKTHHDDFDLDVFLRISVGELWQKRLMAAGFPKTFEIGRVYRNEGSSPDHVQEFTNLEFYWGYANYRDGMKLVERLYKKIAQDVFGKTQFETRGHTFDLADEWVEIDYREVILEKTGIDILTASQEEMAAKLDELHVKYEGDNKERVMDTLWKYCRKQVAGPAFLVNHPKLVSPLSKAQPDNTDLTQRFQIILAGSEIGNGFSELNDPLDQRARFELQQQLLESGDDEAMMPEWDFVEMLEHGMPPTCGFGFGERLFTFLVDKPIRETQFFPLMKPKIEQKKEGEK